MVKKKKKSELLLAKISEIVQTLVLINPGNGDGSVAMAGWRKRCGK